MFPPTSRYSDIEMAKFVDADGKTIVYLRRRFLPSPDRFHLLQEHTVTAGERLDNVTASYLRDPEQFWRICDANAAMNPEDLLKPVGGKLRITLPEGLPGVQDA